MEERESVKVIWTDYFYAAVYVCEEVDEFDYCAEGKEFIDVIARDLDPIPIVVIEELKGVLQRAGYPSGKFSLNKIWRLIYLKYMCSIWACKPN